MLLEADKVELDNLKYELSRGTISAAIEVHKELGPGLLESIYEKALCVELLERGIEFVNQAPVYVKYKGKDLGLGYRADLIIERKLLVELKTVEAINNIHVAQTLTYMKLLGIKYGLIINFSQRLLKHGIKRLSI